MSASEIHQMRIVEEIVADVIVDEEAKRKSSILPVEENRGANSYCTKREKVREIEIDRGKESEREGMKGERERKRDRRSSSCADPGWWNRERQRGC